MASEASYAEQRVEQANKGRSAALSEAAFLRSKVAAMEANSSADLGRLERSRTIDLEKRIVDIGNAKAEMGRRVEELEIELDHHRESAQSAAERESASIERADAAEASYSRALTDYADLQRRAHTHDSSLQEHLARIATLESSLAQAQAQHSHSSSRLDNAETSLEQHLRTLEQTQATLASANSQASEMEALWTRSRDELAQHRERSIQLETDHSKTVKELEAARAQIDGLERALKAGKEEVASMRSLTSGSLTELLNNSRNGSSRGLQADNAHSDQVNALQEEVERHRSFAQEANSKVGSAQTELRDARLQHVSFEKQITLLRGELAGLRTRHASALEASSRAQALVTQRDLDLREKTRTIEATEVKANLLRSLLAENGLHADDSGSPSIGSNSSGESSAVLSRKIVELESRLEQRSQAQRETQHLHDEARQEAESSRQRLRISEEQIDQLNSQIEEMRLAANEKAI